MTRQPILKYYSCLEVMALSGAEMVGVPVRISPPAQGGEQVLVNVEFRDGVAIGNWAPYPITGDFLRVEKEKVAEWIRDKARILTFQGGEWINLDDPKERFFDENFHEIKDVNERIRFMRKAFRDHPEIGRVATYGKPLTPEECKRFGLELDTRLTVPCDRVLERWAIRCLRDQTPTLRFNGVDALSHFDSPENQKRIIEMLKDPDSWVQKRALFVLQNWGVRKMTDG